MWKMCAPSTATTTTRESWPWRQIYERREKNNLEEEGGRADRVGPPPPKRTGLVQDQVIGRSRPKGKGP